MRSAPAAWIALSGILATLFLFLALPTEYLRSEDAVVDQGGTRRGEHPTTETPIDGDSIVHTAFDIPPVSRITFALRFPFPPLYQFHLRLSAEPPDGGSAAGLRIVARPSGGGDEQILFDGEGFRGARDISVPLRFRSRKVVLSLESSSGGVRVRDLRIVPFPLIPMIAGLAILLPLRAAASRRPGGPRTKGRRVAFAAITIGMMAGAVLITLEGFLRLFPAYMPARVEKRIRNHPLRPRRYLRIRGGNTLYDAQMGFRRKPNCRMAFTFSEGDLWHLKLTGLRDCHPPMDIRIAYDDDGFRITGDGTGNPRIAFLGDSLLEGLTSPRPFCEIFQERSGVPCANLGLCGTGTTQQRLILERFGFPRRPGLVLHVFYEGNDLYDNILFGKFLRDGLCREFMEWSYLFSIPPLAFTDSPLEHLLASHFLPEGWGRLRPRYVEPAPAPEPPPAGAHPDGGDALPPLAMANDLELTSIRGAPRIAFCPHSLKNLLADPEMDWVAGGWMTALEDFVKARDECASRGIGYVVCFMPSKSHVYLPHLAADRGPEWTGRYLSVMTGMDAAECLDRLEKQADRKRALLSDFCARNGIPFIDLHRALHEASFSPPLLYHCNDTHLSPRGDEVVAEEMLRWIGENMPAFAGAAAPRGGAPGPVTREASVPRGGG
ncbi:MAG: hypothetical protein PHN82_04375 [bacterium]|nr:hypothetical protein [bacterium]